MKKRGYLLIGGSLNFFIAALHLVTIFVGAKAYYLLDAPRLAVYSELGSTYPAWITLLVTFCFFIAGLYAFCEAGNRIKLPFQEIILKTFVTLFTLRGLFIFWFAFAFVNSPTHPILKEIVFSLFSLIMGALYWMGLSKKRQSPMGTQ